MGILGKFRWFNLFHNLRSIKTAGTLTLLRLAPSYREVVPGDWFARTINGRTWSIIWQYDLTIFNRVSIDGQPPLGTPTASVGTIPSARLLIRNCKWAYVVNEGDATISQFTINATTGELAAINSSDRCNRRKSHSWLRFGDLKWFWTIRPIRRTGSILSP